MSLSINDVSLQKVHFVGVFGSGMSALAQYCLWSGCMVTGSDRLEHDLSTRSIAQKLKALGCLLFSQNGEGITEETSAIVVSSAIEESNPDIIKARSLHKMILHRSDILARIVSLKKTIAVAGTSGKSTVTALIFHMLEQCNCKPSLLCGANLHSLIQRGFIGNAWFGSSDLLVIEADESDGSLVKYHPYITLLLNLSKDHKPIDSIQPLFKTIIENSCISIKNSDDPNLQSLPTTHTFGLPKENASYYPDSYHLQRLHIELTRKTHNFSFPYPGMHSIYNVLAALSVCENLTEDYSALITAVNNFSGTQRRFDRITTNKNITVIDDFAHNPEKIAAILQSVKTMSERIHALFQPHGFGPTRFFFDELVDTFSKTLRTTDFLYILPIYYAGGTVSATVSSEDIAKALNSKCKAGVSAPSARLDAIPLILQKVQPGDIVLSMGARDPSLPDFAKQIADSISNAPFL